MQIRLATPKDIKLYTDLLQTTYQATYPSPEVGLQPEHFSKEIFASADTQKYLASHLITTREQKTWLAFEKSKLVGAITAIILNSSESELTGFYVHPNFQGKGIGKELYQKARNFAGKRDLLLDIYTHNKKTVEMYFSWGWQLDTKRGVQGYFYRHWSEWPADLQVKCMYLRLITYET